MKSEPELLVDNVTQTFDVDAYMDGLSDSDMTLYLHEHSYMAKEVVENCPDQRAIALAIDGRALKACPKKEQTPELVEVAVRQDGYAIKYASKVVLKAHPDLYELAVKSNGLALKEVPRDLFYDGIYEDAVSSNGLALDLIPWEERTFELCLAAVKTNGEALEYVPYRLMNKRLVLAAVSQNGRALQCAPQSMISERICKAAVKNYPEAVFDVPPKLRSPELNGIAVSGNWRIIAGIKRPSKKLLLLAFAQSPKAIEFFPEKWKTEEICQQAFERDCTTMIYFPVECTRLSMVVSWLEYISSPDNHQDSQYLENTVEYLYSINPDWLRTRTVAKLLRELELRETVGAVWSEDTASFHISEKISYSKAWFSYWRDSYEGPCFTLDSYPTNLDELIDLLDGDLTLVDFGSYPFDDYDPSKHDLSTAHIPVSTLRALGAYDDSAFQAIVNLDGDLLSVKPSEQGELVPTNSHTELAVPDDMNSSEAVYYVSDLHLNHKLAAQFPVEATELEISDYLSKVVSDLVSDIPDHDRKRSTLLILGDTSYTFETSRVFYRILRKSWEGRIYVVLGNHELWNGSATINCYQRRARIDEIVAHYREMLDELGIRLLNNELLIRYRGSSLVRFSEEELEAMSDAQLEEQLTHSSLAILGGIGFAGLNESFNATRGIYRNTLTSPEDERALSERFSALHERIRALDPNGIVIVATHMPFRDWSDRDYQPGWIYLSGHTHRNTFIEEGAIRVYEDNQVGYKRQAARLARFFVDSAYDPFRHLGDGIHEVNRLDYIDFNRDRRLSITSFNREGRILMLKREGVSLFLFKWEKTHKLYLLAGGLLTKLENQHPEYYYENMLLYCSIVKDTFSRYQLVIKQISSEIKRLGGTGTIHGCIVDIDYFNHVFLDPTTGRLKYYYALSINDRVEYPDIKALLQVHKPEMLPALSSTADTSDADSAGFAIILRGEDTTLSRSIVATDTLMYRPSRTMLSIQHLFESSVIRIWNEDALKIGMEKRSSQTQPSLPQCP